MFQFNMHKQQRKADKDVSELVDLTLPIHDGMPWFPAPWHPPVEVKVLGTHAQEGRATRELRLGTHTGTHIDAPLHFIEGGESIDRVAIEATVGRAILLDLGLKQPLEPITGSELDKRGDRVSRDSIVVLRTGWARLWGQPEFYREHPYLAEDAAAWLLERGVRALGLDLPGLEDPQVGSVEGVPGPRHVQLMGQRVIVIENLANLSELQEGPLFLIALPLCIVGGDGAPARVIAIQDALIE